MIQMFDAHRSMVRRPFCKRAAAPAMTSNMAKGIKYMQIQFGVDLKCSEMHQTYANSIRARPQIWQNQSKQRAFNMSIWSSILNLESFQICKISSYCAKGGSKICFILNISVAINAFFGCILKYSKFCWCKTFDKLLACTCFS